jgi:hypothetical protein
VRRAAAVHAGWFATACGDIIMLWRPLRKGAPASTPATDRVRVDTGVDMSKHEREVAEALGLRGES